MLPNFYILGAQKAGTTWLAQMLRQHQQVFIPRRKELHYFTKEHRFRRGPHWYRAHFRGGERAQAVGEATPNYLAANTEKGRFVVERIQALTPDARFIVSLRNPVERAIAALLHHARVGRLPPWTDFDGLLLRMLNGRAPDPWDVLAMGMYDVQLEAYFRTFPRERFQVLIHEHDLRTDSIETLRQTCRHLQVSPDWAFHSETSKVNVAVRSRAGLGLAYVSHFCGGVWAARTLERTGWLPQVAFPDTTISALDRFYRPSILRLEAMIGRNLDLWRRNSRS